MPGSMDGFVLRRLLREEYPTIHVVLMTGYAGETSSEEGPILLKPFTAEQAISALQKRRSSKV